MHFHLHKQRLKFNIVLWIINCQSVNYSINLKNLNIFCQFSFTSICANWFCELAKLIVFLCVPMILSPNKGFLDFFFLEFKSTNDNESRKLIISMWPIQKKTREQNFCNVQGFFIDHKGPFIKGRRIGWFCGMYWWYFLLAFYPSEVYGWNWFSSKFRIRMKDKHRDSSKLG